MTTDALQREKFQTTTPGAAPAAPGDGTAPQAPTAPRPRPTRHTVLVVDDEPDVVKSVKDLLRLDYRVIGATSAAEGIQVLETQDVHVVMTDQRMPEMTGVQFLSHIRGGHPEAVRLLFTGYADIRAVIDAINEGKVYRYITKPWDPEELQAIIREACERYDLIVERKELLQILQHKNDELEHTNEELRRANELKYAFIQVASHELRTPLTILQGMTKLATNAATAPASGASDVLKNYLERIDRAARRLQNLVDQIVAMMVAGQFERPLDRRPHDMAAILTEAADDVRPFIELRHQALDVDVPADLGTLDVEAPRVRDSINHLLLNAVKFTPDGGTVGIAARRLSDEGIEITVRDTGAGIDAACRDKLFEPFFTGYDVSRHSSGTYEHGRKGLGLGLSIVKAFVRMHGGSIRCDSEPGRGTTFILTIPANPPPGAAAAGTAAQ